MQYRREIDGLRAVAVLPVILFHAGFSEFSGGFIGVDVFFVISGYLITCILIADLEQGELSIARFYERRARRILPALFVVMLTCLPFAYMWMLPSQLEDFAKSLIAVVFFASNMLFWREDGYFAAAAELKPLLHTWSLAVEEQYYLLFPLFLLLLWRIGRKPAFWSVVAVAVLSFLLAEWGWRNKPSANFYLAPTRAWELLAGSMCAFFTMGRQQRSSNLLSAAGLALVLFAIFEYSESTPFPSVYTLVPVLGTALIILFAAEGTWVARLLSLRSLVGIGLISYSAYLWHQPLFAFARLRSLRDPSDLLMGVLALAALLLGWATWRFVEQPFRNRANGPLVTQRSVFMASGTVGFVFVAIGLAGYIGKGLDWGSNGAESFLTLDARIASNPGLHIDCALGLNDSVNCMTGNSARVLLWGDSYAMHLAQGLLASSEGEPFVQQTMSQCAPILDLAQLRGWANGLSADACIDFNADVLQLITETKFDTVILSSSLYGVLGADIKIATGEVAEMLEPSEVAQALRATVDAVRATGADVVIVSPTPVSGWDIGQCIVKSAYLNMDESSCNFPLVADAGNINFLSSISDYVPIYWLHKDFCSNGVCDVVQDGVFIFSDYFHLSKEGSAYLGHKNNWIERFIRMAN